MHLKHVSHTLILALTLTGTTGNPVSDVLVPDILAPIAGYVTLKTPAADGCRNSECLL